MSGESRAADRSKRRARVSLLLIAGAALVFPSVASSATYRAVADAFVMKSAPRANFGKASRLRIDAAPVSRVYLRFNVGSTQGQVTRAILQVRTLRRVERTILVRGVRRNSWRERSLTYANAPGVSRAIASSGNLRAGVWTGMNITGYVRGKRIVSLALTSAGRSATFVASREMRRLAPRLLVETTATEGGGAGGGAGGGGGTGPTTATLVGAGSIAACDSNGDEITASLIDRIPGTVAAIGDLAYYSGTAAEFANCYQPSWGRFKARTRPATGSREYLTPNAAGYFGYWGAQAGEPGKGYYSYDLGSWHVVVLNSMCAQAGGCNEGSPQERWLRADLAANRATCTLAYWHHPRFSSGGHESLGSDRTYEPFWQALYDAGAEVVLAGHTRRYERFAPQTPFGQADPVRGIRQFIVSTGGVGHFPNGTPAGNSEVRNDDTFGVLKLTLRATGYDWDFVHEPGRTFTDSGSGSCH